MSKGLETLQEYRNESGRKLFEAGHVLSMGPYIAVQSESDFEKVYEVVRNEAGQLTCSCLDFSKRGDLLRCKHIMGAKYLRGEV